ncbi:hypothetical protein [Sphingomonas sp. PAMC 26621]|uniref:hypothetical protein n=1 Tax=Sphingomonas sp. PAMC 26621 TaxID=1112213 RepID=UPI00056903F0|nr:hypothetical protein [Sphingomonas sp. PAMC 26621]
MDLENKVKAIVFEALINLNEEQADGEQIALDRESVLFGSDSMIDSLALVSVIVDVETEVGSEFEMPIALTDDRAMSRQPSPFDTVGTLIDYIVELLQSDR